MSDERANCDEEDGALAAVLSVAQRDMSDLQVRPVPIMVARATRGPFDKNREDDGLVLGIGFDLIDLSDFTRTLKRSGERFIQRIYTKEEIEYCRAQPHPVQSFAVRFAAKEAAMKALGIAGQDGLCWRDFEVVCAASGRPTMLLHGQAAASSNSLQLRPLHISLSLSHSQSAAGAVAIAETAGPRGKAIKRTGTTKRSSGRAK